MHPIDQYAFFKTNEKELVQVRANYDTLTFKMTAEQLAALESYVSYRIEQYSCDEAFSNSGADQ